MKYRNIRGQINLIRADITGVATPPPPPTHTHTHTHSQMRPLIVRTCLQYITFIRGRCITHSKDGNIIFDTLNLNTQANWYTDDPPESSEVPVLCLQQLEKDTIFLGLERILI